MRSRLNRYDETHIGEILTGDGDWFSAKLIRLIADADVDNREALREAYPDHVAAYERWLAGDTR